MESTANELILPNYISIRSTAIDISTEGRFDNNEKFATPIILEFKINDIWY